MKTKESIKKNYFNESLLDILICPLTKESLIWDSKHNELISKKSKFAFPVIDGIPILLVNRARKL